MGNRRVGVYNAKWIALIFMGLLSLSACSTDDEAEPIMVAEGTFPGVDERLWPYFIRFQEQGASRGLTIDLVAEGITGVIEVIDEENIAGTCNFNSRTSNHVMIDAEFWQLAPDLFKEFIVFHELGHCSLFRDHREGADQNGRCISIMRSGLEECRDNYNIVTRTDYLDELYDTQFARDIFSNR
ncbi:hypothetical protein [Roseivirga misakiensis]|uniref:Uncharacterized protein n=1 Tax=Roseivirga misakiensis TaxID=1563681 RepID=A0A1E5SZX4_9BACT|nr:hypothetical protein [Roseivirga misakiensis]OEK04671.1 hypothetical protein BFP71_14555 [Roseivirga misakiensis]